MESFLVSYYHIMNKFYLLFLVVIFLSSQSYSQNIQKSPAIKAIELPARIDHSQSEYFPEIGNQGSIGACDWFAVTYYQMSFMVNRQLKRKATPGNTFSPQFGYSFSCNAQAFPYNIRIDDVYKFATKHGMGNMENIPYTMKDGTGYKVWCTDESIWEDALKYRIAGYSYFTLNGRSNGAAYSLNTEKEFLNEVKKLLSQGEILVIQSETHKGITSTISNDPSTKADDDVEGQQIIIKGNNGYDHTVAVVGYNDHVWVDVNNDKKVQPEERGTIKIADSFGSEHPTPQNKGFHWMTYATFVNSIAENRVNRLSLRENYSRKIICKITLNTAERDKIKFQFGRKSTKTKEDISGNDSKIFDPYFLGYQTGTAGVSLIEGGDFAYDGGKTSTDGSFVFDLTDLYNPGNKDDWFLRISNSSLVNPCIVKQFEIVDIEKNKVVSYSQLPVTVLNNEKYLLIENIK
jgi:hypothetical protein